MDTPDTQKGKPGRKPSGLRRVGYSISPQAHAAIESLHRKARENNARATLTEVIENAVINEAKNQGV